MDVRMCFSMNDRFGGCQFFASELVFLGWQLGFEFPPLLLQKTHELDMVHPVDRLNLGLLSLYSLLLISYLSPTLSLFLAY
jgi:hypothetical protein